MEISKFTSACSRSSRSASGVFSTALTLGALALLFMTAPLSWAAPAFWSWADKPVMGWNSWDFYGVSINEERTTAQVDYMADHLLAHGWNLITVDHQWYEPNASGFSYNANAVMTMDQWGRLTPATNKFPSATGGGGFSALADYIHSKGLKFGIHIMRGIPRQAVAQDTPVKGTAYTASQIADTTSTCSWNADMYGVDMSKPGAQAYYDSVMELVASWGVDFIKIDDLSRPYHLKEIEAIRKAIDKSGRPIIFSTSPGATPVSQGGHVMDYANQWRISDDFWDNWGALYDQFKRLHDWTPYRGSGHFPDADMLPLGKIAGGTPTATGRATNFTTNEQYTLMSLWAIARSPLIHGGDMTRMDSLTLSLMTNDEVISVNQHSTHNRQLFRANDLIAWTADVENSNDKYLAVFNATSSGTAIPVNLADMGFTGDCQIRSLWDGLELGTFTGTFAPSINSHGGALYRISGPAIPVPWLTEAVAGDSRVHLFWEAIPSATSYRVKRALTETGTYQTITSDLVTPEFLDLSVQNATTYHYKVSAMIGGQESPDSGVLLATPAGPYRVVSWNYDNYGTVTGGSVAGVAAAANWNNTWPSNPRTNLIDDSGAQTTVDLAYVSYNTARIQSTHPGADSDGSYNKELLNGYLNAGNATWGPPLTSSSVTLTQIPYARYDIIVYFSSDAGDREGVVTDGTTSYYFKTLGPASIAGANATLTRTSQADDSAYPGANYAIFSGLSGTNQNISVQTRDNNEWAGIAGFQIVSLRDPLLDTSLQIQTDTNAATTSLSWPSGLGSISLQESSDLETWTPVDPQPTTNSVVVPISPSKRFFRLARP